MSVKAELSAVNQILWKDWDPIGCGVPADEYETYAPDVWRLLKDGAGRATLAAHLQRVAKESMSCPISEAKALAVADKLLALSLR
jgi:hypothetical protein